MAGGGVGEAMLIGAAMGAGVGAGASALQKKDPLQGALMGAVGGAATGGLGSAIGGAAGGAAGGGAAGGASGGVGGGVVGGVEGGVAGGAGGGAAGGAGGGAAGGAGGGAAGSTGAWAAPELAGIHVSSEVPAAVVAEQGANAAVTQAPTNAGWAAAGKGTGFAPSLTNAQAYGAGAAGGIGGLMAANNMPGTTEWPEEGYDGPLNYFKYDPTKYKSSEPKANVYTPRYADGGIAGLAGNTMGPMSNNMYPQSQQQQTTFATSPQMPNSMYSAMASDYDARTNPMTGAELPMGFADGGGIGFIRSIQPGGAWGDMTADLYGAAQKNKPEWLQNMEPGGFVGATVPGKMGWEDQQRRKKEAEETAQREQQARAAAIARNTSMQGGMAHGGIASLGGYSDGGQLTRGPGDGVSDSIPASIGGRQPARLADGEFVVPARIVSELGNGSTDAGARRLYDMMDRVQARRSKTMGKGRVAKNTRSYTELPA